MFGFTRFVVVAIMVCPFLIGCSNDDDGGSSNVPAPNAPTSLQVISTGATSVQLQWTDNASDEDAFYVERSLTNNQAYQQVVTLAAGVVTYTDTGLETGARYYYRVRAGRSGSFSAYSNEVFADAEPSGPSVTVVSPNGGEALAIGLEHDVTWTSQQLVGGVDIMLSSDGGNNWPYVIASNVVNTGTYVWTVGDSVGANCRLRVLSHTSTTVYDDSDADFSMYLAWVDQTAPTALSIIDVLFADANNGWAVGLSGTILHTTNGGADWIAQTSGTGNNLHHVEVADPNTAWAISGAGQILHTTNGGSLWSGQTSGTTSALNDITFTDSNIGWVVGSNGVIRHTTNAGVSWVGQTSNTTVSIIGIDFIDANNGWAVGHSGLVRHTTNGGADWVAQNSGTSNFHDVDFTNGTQGWVVGAGGLIQHTTDGGISWAAQTSPYPGTLWEVIFTDDTHGLIVGEGGTILHTIDGGQTWTEQSSGTAKILRAVSFPDADHGWAAGYDGTIVHTSTGGH